MLLKLNMIVAAVFLKGNCHLRLLLFFKGKSGKPSLPMNSLEIQMKNSLKIQMENSLEIQMKQNSLESQMKKKFGCMKNSLEIQMKKNAQ